MRRTLAFRLRHGSQACTVLWRLCGTARRNCPVSGSNSPENASCDDPATGWYCAAWAARFARRVKVVCEESMAESMMCMTTELGMGLYGCTPDPSFESWQIHGTWWGDRACSS